MSVLQKKKRLYESCFKIRSLRYVFNKGYWHHRSAVDWQFMLEHLRDNRMNARKRRKRYREIMRKAGKR